MTAPDGIGTAGGVDARALDRPGLLRLVARIAPELLPSPAALPVAEQVSAILDRVTDHWQSCWHAVLEILPICADGDTLALDDPRAAIEHFTAIRDTIAARLPSLRDQQEELAGLIVDCDRDIADLRRRVSP